MYGLGVQELLVLLVIFVTVFVANPAVTYLLARVGLKALRRPYRVLVAFWLCGGCSWKLSG